jgi:hypothetical protein
MKRPQSAVGHIIVQSRKRVQDAQARGGEARRNVLTALSDPSPNVDGKLTIRFGVDLHPESIKWAANEREDVIACLLDN